MKISQPYVWLLAILFTCVTSSCFAQSKFYKFGKADADHIKMKTFEADPDANAVILFDHGTKMYEFYNDKLRMVYTRHTRIKILAESAIFLANVEVPFYAFQNLEIISGLKGITHNVLENGDISSEKMDKTNVFEEDIDGRRMEKKFTLPNVKVGSVIEYSYSIISYNIYSLRTWYFQSEYPTLYSEVSLGVPDGFNYGSPRIMGEVMPLEKKQENLVNSHFSKGTSFVYIAKDVPALDWKNQVYPPNPYNHLFRLDWELKNIRYGRIFKDYSTNWGEVTEDILAERIYKTSYEPTNSIVKLTASLATSSSDDPMIRANGIFTHIRENYKWNKRYSYNPIYNHGHTLDTKGGSSGNLNLLLVSMLRAAKLDAYPVIMSTRSHGIVQRFFPNTDQFNHVIAAIKMESDYTLMDVTGKNTSFDMLPLKDLNGMGMLITPTDFEWISLTPSKKRQSKVTVSGTVIPDGTMVGTYKKRDQGYGAYFSRRDYIEESNEDKKKFLSESLLGELTDTEIENEELQGEKELEKPFISKCGFTTTDFSSQIGDRIFINPMTFMTKSENPFKIEDRKFPVDYICPIKQQYVLILEIPEGYEVEEMPKDTRMVLPDKSTSFTFQSSQMGSRIQLMTIFEVKKSVFQTSEYPALRAFYDAMVAKHSEKIVLKKVN